MAPMDERAAKPTRNQQSRWDASCGSSVIDEFATSHQNGTGIHRMQLKTILNRVTQYKSFVFGKVSWLEDAAVPAIEVEIVPRRNGLRICSGCDRVRPGYDTMPEPRRFEFVPLWGMTVYFVYQMRRVQCPSCGIKVERIPWAEGKSTMTTELKWFLARWAKRMSWKEVSLAFHVSWDRVFEEVKHAVSWGWKHRSLDGIEAIGVDEVQWHRGHKYQTVVYQLDEHNKRLTLRRFFRFLGKRRTRSILFICSDMWQGYLKVIRKKAAHAVRILDRFHVMQRIAKAINDVRAAEAKQLKQDGYEKIVWLSHTECVRNRLVSQPRSLT
jgi:transposase